MLRFKIKYYVRTLQKSRPSSKTAEKTQRIAADAKFAEAEEIAKQIDELRKAQ